MRTLSEYARGSKKGKGKSSVGETRYGSILLPKKFQFICTPDNGKKGPPIVPKKLSKYYMTLNEQRMIVDIEFTRGTNAYCVGQIQQAFSHLPLHVWRFYSVDRTNLTDVTGICDFETFDIEALALYVISCIILIVELQVAIPLTAR
jgi:hypothetical protein